MADLKVASLEQENVSQKGEEIGAVRTVQEENKKERNRKETDKKQEHFFKINKEILELRFKQFLEEAMSNITVFDKTKEKEASNETLTLKNQETEESTIEQRDLASVSLRSASKTMKLMQETLDSLAPNPEIGKIEDHQAEHVKVLVEDLSKGVGKILGNLKPSLQPGSFKEEISEEKESETFQVDMKNAGVGERSSSVAASLDGASGFGQSDIERLEKIQKGSQNEKEKAIVELGVKAACVGATGGAGGAACEMLAKAAGKLVEKFQEAREEFKQLGTKGVTEFVSGLADSVDTSGPSKEDQEADKGRAIGEEALDNIGQTFTKAYETVQKAAGPMVPKQTPSPLSSPSEEPTQNAMFKPKPS